MSPSRPLGYVFLIGMALSSGCQSQSRPYAGCPPTTDENVASAEDLGLRQAQIEVSGSKLVEKGASVGRFPAGLAIAQVAAAPGEDEPTRRLRLTKTEVDRQVHWGRALHELPKVREVVFMSDFGLDPRGFKHGELLRHAANYGCDLCVIYTRIEESECQAHYVAALWDARKPKLLSTYRVPVLLSLHDLPSSGDNSDEEKMRAEWLYEADCRAEADLRRMVRDDLWDLARRDRAATTQPSPWRTEHPLLPRDFSRLKLFFLPWGRDKQ